MKLLRTEKDTLTPQDISDTIALFEKNQYPQLEKLWRYYNGDNPTIIDKPYLDPTNPDNRTPVPYAHKIITTFTGYAYRPGYITYKSENKAYLDQLLTTFRINNENIKTSLHGRNTGIDGVSYEIFYIGENELTKTPDARFALSDPRQTILLYDYELEPNKKIGIRYFEINPDKNEYKIEVYYKDRTERYTGKRKYNVNYRNYENKIIDIVLQSEEVNFFKILPINAYYMGKDNYSGIISYITPLIDDYDILISGGIVEFDRFANAYIRLVKMSMDKEKAKALKQNRIFEQLPDKDAVTFLTKDIPTAYIQFMTDLIREQIHIQSHVPDLSRDTNSGIQIQRLMFDFETVCSTAEAEFDEALYERIKIITNLYETQSRATGSYDEIIISHKRNAPLNLLEFSQISMNMKNAGFSDYLVADVWPDDIIPDVQVELDRQAKQREEMIPDIENVINNNNENIETDTR